MTFHVPVLTRQRKPARRAISHALSPGRGWNSMPERANRPASAASRSTLPPSSSRARLGRGGGGTATIAAAGAGAGGVTATAALLGATPAGRTRWPHHGPTYSSAPWPGTLEVAKIGARD